MSFPVTYDSHKAAEHSRAACPAAPYKPAEEAFDQDSRADREASTETLSVGQIRKEVQRKGFLDAAEPS